MTDTNTNTLETPTIPTTHITTQPSTEEKIMIGASFPIWQTGWLSGWWDGLEQGTRGPKWQESLRQMCNMGFSSVRLNVEWDEVEKRRGKYDFSVVEEAIAICAQRKVPVVLNVGMKVISQPEHHAPEFYDLEITKPDEEKRYRRQITTNHRLAKPLTAFMTAAMDKYGNDPRVSAIQIENEPFEATGLPETTISLALLEQEVILARSRTKKPIWLTVGAGHTEGLGEAKRIRPRYITNLLKLKPDAIGLNVYQRGYGDDGWQFDATDAHWEFTKKLVAQIRKGGSSPVITEVGVMPWLANPDEMDLRDPNGNLAPNGTPAFTPADCIEIIRRSEQLGCDMMLWGVPYQIACAVNDLEVKGAKQAGQKNTAWLDTTREFMKRYKR